MNITIGNKRVSFSLKELKKLYKSKNEFIEGQKKNLEWIGAKSRDLEKILGETWDQMFPQKVKEDEKAPK